MTKKTLLSLSLMAAVLVPLITSAQSKYQYSYTTNTVVAAAVNTVASTVAPTTYIFTKTLSMGMSGTAVTQLQKRLTALGVYSGDITGYFGSLTKAAVMLLQSKNGLELVGSVGPLTRAILNKPITATTTVNTVNVPAPSTTSTSSTQTTKPVAQTPPAAQSTTSTQTQTQTQTQTSGSTATTQSTVSSGLQWGMFAGNGSPSGSSLVSTLGKTPDITAIFAPWTDGFPTYESSVCSSGKTLLIFWENYNHSLDNIINGTYDSYLKSWSAGAASYKCPVIVSLFHEMNGNWDDWDGTVGTNSPAKIIAAWKHVHDLVTASNVKWAWAVNNESVPNTTANDFTAYYPGSAYVDYVGVDGFNFGNPWQTFGQVFDKAIAKLQQYNKPIYIFSMGSVAGSQKAAWISEGLGTHVKTYSNIKGWIWFNESQSAQNWLIDTDTASMAAFRAALP